MIPFDLPPWFVLSWLFLLGAVIGSFLTVCVHRLPAHQTILAGWGSLIHNPSHCDRCHQGLLIRDNIPILGWIFLGGKCRFCRQSIPVRYPLIEFANGTLFCLLYWMEVPFHHWIPLTTSCLTSDLGGADFSNSLGLTDVAMIHCRYFYHLVLVEALFVAALIDWDSRMIPDSITVPASCIAVLGASCFGTFWLVPIWFESPEVTNLIWSYTPESLRQLSSLAAIPEGWIENPYCYGFAVSMAGLAVGGALVSLVRYFGFRLLKTEVMGSGDVMLLAMIGAFLGWQPAVIVFFLAPALTLCAVLTTGRFRAEQTVAYGPSLCVSAMLTLLGWNRIWANVAWIFWMGPLSLIWSALLLICLAPLLWWFSRNRMNGFAH